VKLTVNTNFRCMLNGYSISGPDAKGLPPLTSRIDGYQSTLAEACQQTKQDILADKKREAKHHYNFQTLLEHWK